MLLPLLLLLLLLLLRLLLLSARVFMTAWPQINENTLYLRRAYMVIFCTSYSSSTYLGAIHRYLSDFPITYCVACDK